MHRAQDMGLTCSAAAFMLALPCRAVDHCRIHYNNGAVVRAIGRGHIHFMQHYGHGAR